ncbi:hypothetical protein FT641_26950 [Bacillus paranthracis]|uniref:hypothetical protein n=1 Tax=Bacillus paranthracis TaxID=2026186 RepID=UPI00187998E1|nr:hypothetical protein [Bacillus paranthracis]MBE7117291.1 hypothetical protein [Bacillus paranthracis]MBE7156314.1 hypothetical protein [Bacillus paranthracis]
MFTNHGGHITSTVGASGRIKSRLDKFKDENKEHVDKISLELIRGNYEVHETEVSVGMFEDQTKMKVLVGGRYEVTITIKG